MKKSMKNSELRRAISETLNSLREGVKNPFTGSSGIMPDDIKAQLKAHLDQLLTCEQVRACGLHSEKAVSPESTRIDCRELEWSKTLLDGDRVTYEQAEKAVAKLGDGWRLPTRKELESLVDTSRHDPAIDTEKFPDTKSTYYWTSTPCAWNDAARWVVDFDFGLVNGSRRNVNACVRAVRASQ